MPAYTKAKNDAKLEELILFISSRSEDDERFGSTKLNKLLFFADFTAYINLGTAITNHPYMRLPNGPAPKAMLPTLKRMVEKGILAIKERDHFGKMQKVPVALRKADLKEFTSDEIAIVAEVMDCLRRKNAKGISSLSHKFDGWKLAKDREEIPYEVALVEFKKPRKRDIDRALERRVELSALRRESRQLDADH
jgi:uncharacterized phage-associated protein